MNSNNDQYTDTPYIVLENGVPFHAKVIGLPFFRIWKDSNAGKDAKPKVKIGTI